MANYPQCPICKATGCVGDDMPHCACIYGTFESWSPAQLAHAVGYRINIKSFGGGQRSIWLRSPCGKEHPTGHTHAHKVLSRLAKRKGVDPWLPPTNHPRALINGVGQ